MTTPPRPRSDSGGVAGGDLLSLAGHRGAVLHIAFFCQQSNSHLKLTCFSPCFVAAGMSQDWMYKTFGKKFKKKVINGIFS